MYNPYAGLDADQGSKSTVWLRHEDRELLMKVYGSGALTALFSSALHNLANELRKYDITDPVTNSDLTRTLWFNATGVPNYSTAQQDSRPDDRRRTRSPRRRAS